MCQSETMHQITDFFSANNRKGYTNDNITDNKDSNNKLNNNKCVSVTVSVKTVKKKWEKVLQTFYNLTPGLTFCKYWLDICDVKNKHITRDDLHIIININISMSLIFVGRFTF